MVVNCIVYLETCVWWPWSMQIFIYTNTANAFTSNHRGKLFNSHFLGSNKNLQTPNKLTPLTEILFFFLTKATECAGFRRFKVKDF